MGGSKNRRHDPLGSETEPLRPPQTAKEVKDLLAEAMAGIHAGDRKSTRLNSSHSQISYAVFCLKKKKRNTVHRSRAQRGACLQERRHLRDPVLRHLPSDVVYAQNGAAVVALSRLLCLPPSI